MTSVLRLTPQSNLFDLDLWPLGQFKVIQLVKLAQAIHFMPFKIGLWYMVCRCMTIRLCVWYHRNISFDLWPKGQILSEACKVHNYFVFKYKSMIFGVCLLVIRLVCHILFWRSFYLWPHSQINCKARPGHYIFVFLDWSMISRGDICLSYLKQLFLVLIHFKILILNKRPDVTMHWFPKPF